MISRKLFITILLVSFLQYAFSQDTVVTTGAEHFKPLSKEYQKRILRYVNHAPERRGGYIPVTGLLSETETKIDRYDNVSQIEYSEITSHLLKNIKKYEDALKYFSGNYKVFCFSFDKNGDIKEGSSSVPKGRNYTNHFFGYELKKRRRKTFKKLTYKYFTHTYNYKPKLVKIDKTFSTTKGTIGWEYIPSKKDDLDVYTQYLINFKGERKKLVTYEYTNDFKIVKTTHFYDSDTYERDFIYDAQGRILQTISNDRNRISSWNYSYDDLGFLTKISIEKPNQKEPISEIRYTYSIEKEENGNMYVTANEIYTQKETIIEDNKYIYLFDKHMNWLYKAIKIKRGPNYYYSDIRARTIEYY